MATAEASVVRKYTLIPYDLWSFAPNIEHVFLHLLRTSMNEGKDHFTTQSPGDRELLPVTFIADVLPPVLPQR